MATVARGRCSRSRSAPSPRSSKDTWIDYAVRVFSIAGLAMPSFWLGMIIILALLIVLSMAPAADVHAVLRGIPWDNLPQLIWPALAVGYRYSAVATRMMRSTHARGAAGGLHPHRARQGVYERLVVIAPRAANAMLPVITVIGLEFAFLIGGLVVTEQVFNLNGIGKLFVQAISRRDLHPDPGAGLLVAAVFMSSTS